MCTGAIPYSNSFFGKATGVFLVDNVRCQGTEENLLDCSRNAVGVINTYCDHSDDVGVQCPRKYVHETVTVYVINFGMMPSCNCSVLRSYKSYLCKIEVAIAIVHNFNVHKM